MKLVLVRMDFSKWCFGGKNLMRLCTYVVKIDTGFAPNPFWGYCTLAACTPNHKGAKIQTGDWIMGNTSVATGNKLLYVMQVSEVLPFDKYFNDPRFQNKKPQYGKTWREICGDNIYYRTERGLWAQLPNPCHNTLAIMLQDTKNPRVFIGDHFYYFGENAPDIPENFDRLILRSQGIKWQEGILAEQFLRWIEKNFETGVQGDPKDKITALDKPSRSCTPRSKDKPLSSGVEAPIQPCQPDTK